MFTDSRQTGILQFVYLNSRRFVCRFEQEKTEKHLYGETLFYNVALNSLYDESTQIETCGYYLGSEQKLSY